MCIYAFNICLCRCIFVSLSTNYRDYSLNTYKKLLELLLVKIKLKRERKKRIHIKIKGFEFLFVFKNSSSFMYYYFHIFGISYYNFKLVLFF